LIASLSQFVILLRLLGDLSAHASYGIILMIGRVYTSDLPGRRNAIIDPARFTALGAV
jgi:hypothetical protein